MDIAGATDITQYAPNAADVGFRLRIKETATTPTDGATTYSAPMASDVGDSLLQSADLTITRATEVGATITASDPFTIDDGLTPNVSYTFSRSVTTGGYTLVQTGANPQYAITSLDLGHTILIDVTATVRRSDNAEQVDSRESELESPVVSGPPANDASPSVTRKLRDHQRDHLEHLRRRAPQRLGRESSRQRDRLWCVREGPSLLHVTPS